MIELGKRINRRDTNIELFRIICILGITMHHMVYHSGALYSDNHYVRAWSQFINMFGHMGVNGFILISSNFLMEGNHYLKKAIKFHNMIWIYSILFLILSVACFPGLLNLGRIVKSLFPIMYNHWWYVTSYIGFLLVAPAIKKLAITLKEKEYLVLVSILTVILSIIPSFSLYMSFVDAMNFVWFVYMALLLNFIKQYGENYKAIKLIEKPYVWIISYALMFFTNIIMGFIGDKISVISDYSNFYAQCFSIFQLLGSLSLFLWIMNKKIPYIRIINVLGANTLLVYLVQSNTFFSKLLWEMDIFQIIQKDLLFPVWVFIIAFIMMIAVIIGSFFTEAIRRSICGSIICSKLDDSLDKVDW